MNTLKEIGAFRRTNITVHQDFIFEFGLRWADDRATRWANFLGAVTHLSN